MSILLQKYSFVSRVLTSMAFETAGTERIEVRRGVDKHQPCKPLLIGCIKTIVYFKELNINSTLEANLSI